ncbi:MAG TPA: UPF0182 family protein, partial [Gemmatimonadales bacterium]|nr:UPF0182 family protein [Gemmatimonadales bacterium]
MSAATRRVRLWLALLGAAVLALVVVPSLAGLLTDWWWFQEIGYRVVFTRQVLARGDLFLAVFAVTAAILQLNLRIAQRGIVLNPVVMRVGPTTPQLDVSRSVRRLTPWVVVVIGFFAGLAGTSLWDVVLAALNRTPFGVTDPVFGRDVGFYVFTLPALTAGLAYL